MNKLLTLIVISSLFLPGILFAHPSVTSNDAAQHNYCLKVVVFEVENQRRMTEIKDTNLAKEAEVISAITKIRNDQDKALAAYKESFVTTYREHVAQLNDEKLKERLQKAQDTYLAELDAVVATYRAEVNGAINKRKETFVAADAAFSNRVQQILAKTKADCDAKVDTKTIFTYLTTNLKAAHTALLATINELSKSEIPVISRTKLAAAKEVFNNEVQVILNIYEN